jgi:hypothetical protein
LCAGLEISHSACSAKRVLALQLSVCVRECEVCLCLSVSAYERAWPGGGVCPRRFNRRVFPRSVPVVSPCCARARPPARTCVSSSFVYLRRPGPNLSRRRCSEVTPGSLVCCSGCHSAPSEHILSLSREDKLSLRWGQTGARALPALGFLLVLSSRGLLELFLRRAAANPPCLISSRCRRKGGSTR